MGGGGTPTADPSEIPKEKENHDMQTRTCDYVKPNGEFCGSLALRGRDYCHFHLCYAGRRVRADKQDQTTDGPTLLDLPPLEDVNSIQIAVMQVMDALQRRRISPKVSGQLLYALQIASMNLKLGVDFRAGTREQSDNDAVLCSRYDCFEEDFGIAEQADELRSAEPEEEEKKVVKAPWPGGKGEVEEMKDGYYVSVDADATPEEQKKQATYWVKKTQEEKNAPAPDPQLWREAGRQKVLFGLRKPPAQVLLRRHEPEADFDAAWGREKTSVGD